MSTGLVDRALAVGTAAIVLGAVAGWVAGRASTSVDGRRLRWQADHDDLTQLLNRAGFYAATAAVMAACRRRVEGVWVLVVDLEEFKTVNDVHGHAAGDAVLVGVGALLRHLVADLGGVAGRLGGDEFAVVVPEIGAGDLDAVAATVAREMTRAYRVPEKDGSSDLDQLLQDAGSAMYAAKRSCGGWSLRGAGIGGVAGPGAASAGGARRRPGSGSDAMHPLGRAG